MGLTQLCSHLEKTERENGSNQSKLNKKTFEAFSVPVVGTEFDLCLPSLHTLLKFSQENVS